MTYSIHVVGRRGLGRADYRRTVDTFADAIAFIRRANLCEADSVSVENDANTDYSTDQGFDDGLRGTQRAEVEEAHEYACGATTAAAEQAHDLAQDGDR